MKRTIDVLFKGLDYFAGVCFIIAFFSFWLFIGFYGKDICYLFLFIFLITGIVTAISVIIYAIARLSVKTKYKNKEKRYQHYYKSIPNVLKAKEEELNTNFEKWYAEQKNTIDTFLLQDKKKVLLIRIVQFIVIAINITIAILIIIPRFYIDSIVTTKFDLSYFVFDILLLLFFVSVPTLFIQYIWRIVVKPNMVIKSYLKNRNDFKQEILPSLIASFSIEYTYSPTEGIPQEEFLRCNFLYNLKKTNKYSSQDLIFTKKGKGFKIAECEAIEKTEKVYRNTGGLEIKLFHGLMLLTAPLSKSNKWLFIGPYERSLIETNENVIKLENELYDSLFLTLTNDPVYARQVLTPRFIEFVILFHYYAENYNCYFSYNDHSTSIALQSKAKYKEEFFEFEGAKSVSKENLFYIYKILNMFSSFYKEFVM